MATAARSGPGCLGLGGRPEHAIAYSPDWALQDPAETFMFTHDIIVIGGLARPVERHLGLIGDPILQGAVDPAIEGMVGDAEG